MNWLLKIFLTLIIFLEINRQSVCAQSVQLQVVYSFAALNNGLSPYGSLCSGQDGSFYGTTYGGGASSRGTVFRVTTNGALTTLVSFAGTNGANPYAGLAFGSDGSLYGTTYGGGGNSRGTVFRVKTNGVLTTLVSFAGTNGANPYAGLALGNDGNFYGTTYGGGTSSHGTVFRVTTNGALTTLASFAGTNGANPYAGLTLGNNGNFYGTTYNGGANGNGTIFMVSTNGALYLLSSFNNDDGANPYGGLVLGNDGNFYGTTSQGGDSGYGTVFQVMTNGLLTRLQSFEYINGATPYAGLTLGGDGNFYGVTSQGGDSGYGTVFQVTTNGALTTLLSFEYTNGATPYAGLTPGNDGNFYGTASAGGSSGPGVIYNLPQPIGIATPPISQSVSALSNATFTVIASGGMPYAFQWLFAGTNIAGATNNTLTLSNITFLNQGNYQVVVANSYSSVTSSPALLTVLPITPVIVWTNPTAITYGTALSSNQLNATASTPGNFAYTPSIGTALNAGTNTLTAVFTPTDMADYNAVTDTVSLAVQPEPLTVTASDATRTYGQSNPVFTGILIGVTNGDSISAGYICSATPTSSPGTYAIVPNLNDPLNQLSNYAVMENNGTLTVTCATLTMTPQILPDITNNLPFNQSFIAAGGAAPYSLSVVDGLLPPGLTLAAGINLTTILSFNLTNGYRPNGDLTAGNDGNFYGATRNGGNVTLNDGCVFKLTLNGTQTTLATFNNTNGSRPFAGLVLGNDGNFYGTTRVGGTGSLSDGTVFRVTTNGILTTLVSFAGTNGANPEAGLISGNDGNFYGTTYGGGSHSDGTVFQITSNGALTTLVSFAGTNGANPQARLILGNDGNFYGTTYGGGSYSDGTVFRVTTNGILTTLVSFAGTNGANPEAGLISGNDGNFYGTTYGGGTSSRGTVFRVTTNGTLTMLVTFTGTNGANPEAGLTLGNDGNFYGTTYGGGSHSLGTVFEVAGNGVLTMLVSFATTNGANPAAGLTFGIDGNLYGTTFGGGSHSDGTVFELANPYAWFNNILAGTPTQPGQYLFALQLTDTNGCTGAQNFSLNVDGVGAITTQPQSLTNLVGTAAAFSLSVTGYPAPSYQWYLNGASLSGATNSSYAITSVLATNAGSYTAVAYNFAGSVTSSPALLTVLPLTPVVTWSNPAPITYGMIINSNQLNAVASVPGIFNYFLPGSYTPNVGNYTLSVIFVPNDTANYVSVTDSVPLVVTSAQLTVSAFNSTRAYGQTDPVFTGTIIGLTNGDNITAIFSTTTTSNSPVGVYAIVPFLADPNNRLPNYFVTTNNGTLSIVPATPMLGWTNPASISYGTALGTNQLNATTSVAGIFNYTPTNGTALNVGTNTLTVIFTPTDTADYNSLTGSVSQVVLSVSLTVTANNVTRAYGQTNPVFTGSLSGVVNNDNITAAYAAGATSNSPVGIYPIVPALIDPNSRQTNYSVTIASGTLTITQATPIVSWATPSNLVYGASLTTNQLNAAANVPGAFTYSPTNGSVLYTGSNTLTAVFTPTDSTDYLIVTNTVILVVQRVSLTVTANNASRNYGQTNPVFSGILTGVINGDNISATYSTTATSNSPAGTYAIIPLLSDPNNRLPNYSVTTNDGILTITSAVSTTYSYTFITNNGSIAITGYTGTNGAVQIPSTINGLPVTSILSFNDSSFAGSIIIPGSVTNIADYAFDGITNLTSVTIPTSITSLGVSIFTGCTSLNTISLPSNVTRIGTNCFADCESLTNLTLPSGLTNLSPGVFLDCSNLSAVSLPIGLSAIGNNAFAGCTSLTNISIPYTVSSIGISVFAGCTDLTTINLTNGLNSIGDSAFAGCTSLTNVSLPLGCTTIGNSIFSGCTSLNFCNLPATLTGIGTNAFAGCTSLQSITIPTNILNLSLSIFAGCTSLTTINLPNGLTGIGDDVFAGCSHLAGVTLPSTTVSLGASSFYDCTSITSITIPGNLVNLGTNCFAGCTSLTNVSLPTTINNINISVFAGDVSLTTINLPNGLTGIDDSAFAGCTGLSHVTLPSTLIYLGSSVFSDCTNITAINLPTGLTSIGDDAFSNCTHLASLSIPVTVTNLGVEICYDCVSLTSINLPTGISAVPPNAFFGCSSLTSITFPTNILSIGNSAFYGCSSLTSITLPSGLQTIGQSAFQQCSRVISISIPSSCTTISANAFTGCTQLTQITVPPNVISIGSGAFSGCPDLSTVTFQGNAPSADSTVFTGDSAQVYYTAGTSGWSVSFGGALTIMITSVNFTATPTIGVTPLTVNFACPSVDSLTNSIVNWSWNFGDGATSTLQNPSHMYTGNGLFNPYLIATNSAGGIVIGSGPYIYTASTLAGTLFNFVTNNGTINVLNYIGTNANLVVPSTINGFPVTAISGIWNSFVLTNIEIPSSVTNITTGVFYACPHLASIIVDSGNPSYSSYSGALYDLAQTALLECPPQASGSLNVPGTVVNVADLACYECFGLTNINFPAGVTNIGNYSLYQCSGLRSLNLPSSLTTIGFEALYNCSQIPALALPNSLTSLGQDAFLDCVALTNITVSSSLTAIPAHAFDGCQSLKSVAVPSGVAYIGVDAFLNCFALTNISLPSGLKSIDSQAFLQCSGLLSVAIPNTVTNIGDEAFYYCTSLTNVVLPTSLRTMGTGVFGLCYGLPSVLIPANITTIGDDVFYDCTNLFTVTLSSGLTSIGISAFSDCTQLQSISIPNSVSSIATEAFLGCSRLSSVTLPAGITSLQPELFAGCSRLSAISLPDTVNIIGSGAFLGCTNLPSINIPSGVTNIGDEAFFDCFSLGGITLPPSLNYLGIAAFSGCHSLPNVTFPASLTSISQQAFFNCYGLTNINLGSGVVNIGVQAFAGCVGLASIVIPSNVTSIGDGAFSDCFNLTSITLPNSLANEGQGIFSGCTGLANITLPAGTAVISVSQFSGCTSLTNINIPSTVTAIENYAFQNCIALTSITISNNQSQVVEPPGSGFAKPLVVLPPTIVTIGIGAFQGCTNLSSATLPSGIISIGDQAFAACTSLTNFTIPATVTGLGKQVFVGDSSLIAIMVQSGNLAYSSINGVLFNLNQSTLLTYPPGLAGPYAVPGTVTNISDYAFFGCARLSGLALPSSLLGVGNQSFYGCTGLGSLTVPGNVSILANQSFQGCTGLTNLTLNSGLVTLGIGAFSYCTGLTNVTLPATLANLGDSVFQSCTNLFAINVNQLNPSFTAIGGVLYNSARDTLEAFPAGLGGSYSITNGTTNIRDFAFFDSLRLTNVIVPATVTNLQAGAFQSNALKSIYFNGNSPIVTNDTSVFYGDNAIVYYYTGTTGWGTNFDGLPTVQLLNSIITWPTPSSIIYGAALGAAQLNATNALPGTYVYTPPFGTILNSGLNALSVTFTPANNSYPATNVNVSLLVQPAPLIINVTSLTRPYGTTNPVLTGTLVGLVDNDNITAAYYTAATTNSPIGNYSISPTLSDPNNRLTNYIVTTNLGTLTVLPTTYTFAWPQPSSIVYGTALTSTQLNSSASIAGSFVYTPASATVLTAGSHNLSVSFSPSNTFYPVTNFTVQLTVQNEPLTVAANNASRVVGSANPAFTGTITGIVNGDNITAMYSTTATTNSVAGNYPITPALVDPNGRLVNYTVTTNLGTLSIVLQSSLGLVFFTNNGAITMTGYSGTNANVIVPAVTNGYPVVAVTGPWGNTYMTNVFLPVSITNVASGSFSNCSALLAISVDTNNSYLASFNGALYDKPLLNLLECPPALSGTYMLPRSTINVTANAFTFCSNLTNLVLDCNLQSIQSYGIAYCAALATLYLPSGLQQIGSGSFFGDTALVTISNVNSYSASWSPTEPITYGSPLSSSQLNASASVAGSFSYAPTTGAILPAGSGNLSVSFTPTLTFYPLTNFNATCVISPAPLTVTASNYTRISGATNPLLTGTITGIVNGDNIAASFTTTASVSSPAGNYPIIPSLVDPNGRLVNYTITTNIGILTVVTPNLPQIVTGPASQLVSPGANVSFSVTANGGTPRLGYQWFFNNAILVGKTNTTLSLTFVTTNNNGSYAVVVTNNYGSVTSAVASLTVALTPVFTLQPQSQAQPIGNTVKFMSLAAGQSPIKYQWYFNSNLLAGATNLAFNYGPILTNQSGSYQVVASNSYGSTISTSATLSVLAQPNAYGISNATTGTKVLFLGSIPGTTNVVWASTNLAQPVSSWQTIGTVIAGANGLFQFNDTNANSYKQRFYTLSLIVFTPPAITIQPQALSVIIGNSATFSAGASGTPPLYYQWYFNNAVENGATNQALTINPALTNEGGNYQLVVTNLYGSATSAPTLMTVLLQPNLYGFIQGSNNSITLDLASTPGSTNRLWTSTNLVNWQLLSTNAAGANGLFQYTDTISHAISRKFYRLSTP